MLHTRNIFHIILLDILFILFSLKSNSQIINLDTLFQMRSSGKSHQLQKIRGLVKYQGDLGKSAISYNMLKNIKAIAKIDSKKITTSILISSISGTKKYYLPVYQVDLHKLDKFFNKTCILSIEGFVVVLKNSESNPAEFIITKIDIVE